MTPTPVQSENRRNLPAVAHGRRWRRERHQLKYTFKANWICTHEAATAESEFLVNKTYDVLQPDTRICGGILMARKIAVLAESFGVPCIQHGTSSLALAGYIQAGCAMIQQGEEEHDPRPPRRGKLEGLFLEGDVEVTEDLGAQVLPVHVAVPFLI